MKGRVTGAAISAVAGVSLLTVAAYAVMEFRAYSPIYRPLVVQFVNQSLGGMDVVNESVRLGASATANCENPNPYGFVLEEYKSGSVMLSDDEGMRQIGNVTVPPAAIEPGSSALVELDLAAQVSMLEGMSLMMERSVAIFFTISAKVDALPRFLYLSKRVSMIQDIFCGLSVDFSHGNPNPGPIHCWDSMDKVDLNATDTEESGRLVVNLSEQMLSKATTLKNWFFIILIVLSAALGICLMYLAFRLLNAPATGKKARELKRSTSTNSGRSAEASNEPQESNESNEPQGNEPQTNDGVDSAV